MSKLIATRADFQDLSALRLTEASTLLERKQWSGAYYLMGYAIELSLKSCIIKVLMETDAFPDKEFSKNCYTHGIEKLVQLAGLKDARDAAVKADPDLAKHWGIVKDWTEEKRYHYVQDLEANQLWAAISDPQHGVYQWIKSQW
ncbi:MAG: DNA-binding protein [Planctomycetales bacterium]